MNYITNVIQITIYQTQPTVCVINNNFNLYLNHERRKVYGLK
jgi:hypothetical protein